MRTIFFLICTMLSLTSSATVVEMSSPNHSYLVRLTDEGGIIQYDVKYNNHTIILPSQLGIQANTLWNEGLSIVEQTSSTHDSEWTPVYGERNHVKDSYQSYQITIKKNGSNDKLELEFRLYDEGIAFRYRFPGGQYLTIKDELTTFTLPEGTKAYFTPRAQTPYSVLSLSNWPDECERPLLLELPNGTYVCLSEAKVVDYVRTKFRLSSNKTNTIVTAMYGQVDEIAPYQTPWRVIMYGEKAGDIISHSDLFLNLNDPCQIKDPTWIKPGKVMREVTLSTEGGKALVDFAVKRHLQYIHFDAGWYGYEYDKESDATTVTLDPKRNPNINALNLQEVIQYAKSKDIGVIVYVNQRALQQQLDEILPLYKSWGVAGIKFGFVQVGSQVWTKWMHEAVKKCADYGLMVDIHDEYRPTGFSRTYPNLMTQEGIRGNEEFPDATHNVTLPFTRFVAGPADYTICYYRQDFGDEDRQADNHGVPRSKVIKTTPAHQLALSVVYYSPLQYMYWYDKPSDSQDEPELKFFDDVYTTWDDTKILQGEVGQSIITARRKGEEWFIGALTNNESRSIQTSLSFLPEGRNYIAEIYTDGDKTIKTRTHVKCLKFRVNNESVLQFQLKASGGAAIRIVPEQITNPKIKKYKGQIL